MSDPCRMRYQAEAEETVEPVASGMVVCERRDIPVPEKSDRDTFIRKVMSAGGDGHCAVLHRSVCPRAAGGSVELEDPDIDFSQKRAICIARF